MAKEGSTDKKKKALCVSVFCVTLVAVVLFFWIFYCLNCLSEWGTSNQFQYVFFEGLFMALSVFVNLIVSLGVVVYGLIGYFEQEEKEYKQSTSQYLSNMNVSYTKNKDFTDIYHALDIIYHYEQRGKENSQFDESQYKEAVKYLMETTVKRFSLISNYLSFFEIFNVLLGNDSIRYEDMNDLFYYRFFLAAQCGIIRNQTIRGTRQEFFRNVYDLQERWSCWRKDQEDQKRVQEEQTDKHVEGFTDVNFSQEDQKRVQEEQSYAKVKLYANNFDAKFIREIFAGEDENYIEKMTLLFQPTNLTLKNSDYATRSTRN